MKTKIVNRKIFKQALTVVQELNLAQDRLHDNSMMSKYLRGKKKLKITSQKEWLDFLTVIAMGDHEIMQKYANKGINNASNYNI